MFVLIHLLHDFWFFGFCLVVSLLTSVFFIFFYKNQFFFLFCLPYFLITNTNTFLVTTPFSMFSSCFYLVFNVFLLVYPVFLVLCCILFFLPILYTSSIIRFLKKCCKYFVLFLFLVNNSFIFLIACFFYLVGALGVSQYYIMFFTFDFSIDSWLLFILSVLLCLLFLLFFYLFVSSFIGYTVVNQLSSLFRIGFTVFIVILLVLFAPPDAFVHSIFFLISLLILESLFVYVCLKEIYFGRVA